MIAWNGNKTPKQMETMKQQMHYSTNYWPNSWKSPIYMYYWQLNMVPYITPSTTKKQKHPTPRPWPCCDNCDHFFTSSSNRGISPRTSTTTSAVKVPHKKFHRGRQVGIFTNPMLKNMVINNGSFPHLGMKMKNIANHRPDSGTWNSDTTNAPRTSE